MKQIKLIVFSLLLFGEAMQAQQLQLKDITSGRFSQRGVEDVVSSPDGEYFYKTDPDNTLVVKYAFKTGIPVDTVFDVKRARECHFDSFDGFVMSPDEKRLLVYRNTEHVYRRSYKADYYYYDIRRNLVRKLTDKKEKQSSPVFSKDGRMLAYVCENNIWLAKFDYGTESQVTKDGMAGKIINGATDWVYEEEFETTHIMDFSSDNSLLAFVRFDESEVPEFSFQKYKDNLYPKLQSFKYPKAGETNSKVTCQVFDIEAKTTKQVNLPSSGWEYIPMIQFLPDQPTLAVMTLNREQNVFDMYMANPRSLVAKSVLQERNKYFVDSELLKQIRFIPGHFLYVSEKDGYNQIYLYNNAGVLQKQLTTGKFDVTDLLAVDPGTKTVYYQAAGESPLRREIYKLNMEKGLPVKLTSQAGTNRAEFAENGKYFVNFWNNTNAPSVVTVNDANGKQLRVLEDNSGLVKVLQSTTLPTKEFTRVKAADGTTALNAWIMRPTRFDPSKKYPLVMVQYSGPNSQQVLDSYGIDWVHYLAEQGYVVACVDGRGTGARGEEFRKQTYKRLGVLESDDQIAAAHELGKLSYIDPSRIGIWGWSFGGQMVLMTMGRGNGVFKAGVSIAPVTNWRFYDTVYTERFMTTPQQNEAGYREGSPITYADTFQGKLLLVHGTADDNVHFQNSLEYVRAMIDAGKQFEMFVFPDKDHSIRGGDSRRYLYEKIIQFYNDNL